MSCIRDYYNQNDMKMTATFVLASLIAFAGVAADAKQPAAKNPKAKPLKAEMAKADANNYKGQEGQLCCEHCLPEMTGKTEATRGVRRASSVVPALDRSPGGLAWVGW